MLQGLITFKKKKLRNKDKKKGKGGTSSERVDKTNEEKDYNIEGDDNTVKETAAVGEPRTQSTPASFARTPKTSPSQSPENSSSLIPGSKSAPLPTTNSADAFPAESDRVKVNATTVRIGKLDVFLDKVCPGAIGFN